MPTSGNHGRSNAEPPPSGIGSLVPSTAPQQSTRGFVAPTSMPIKKTPDITDIIGESRKQKAENENDETMRRCEDERIRQLDNERIKAEEIESDSSSNHLITSSSNPHIVSSSHPLIPEFPTIWQTAFENIFSSVPTIYIPLKETLPKIENNIIKVSVKNEIQKEHFEAKTREVLAFLRTHFDEQIENIIVQTDEQLQTKKIIYDVKDKLQNFKEQNVEFDDFVQILDLKIKD